MITINQPKIIAQTQNYSFDSITINHDPKGLQAIVTFNLYNENSEIVDNIRIVYSGEEFNTFWNNFNSGTYLYQSFLAKEKIIAVVADNSLETDFTNVITPVKIDEPAVISLDPILPS